MESVKPTLLGALGRHLGLLLRCRHDGMGLPTTASPVLLALAIASLLASLVLAYAGKFETWWGPLVDVAWQVVWLAGMYFAMARPQRCVEVFAGLLLLSVLFSTVRLLGLALPDLIAGLVRLVFGVWVLVAQLSLLKRHLVRIETAPKRNSFDSNEEQ